MPASRWEKLAPPKLRALSRYFPGVLLLALFLMGLLGEQGLIQLSTLKDERLRLEASIREQEQLNIKLRRQVRQLQNDKRYLERLAREEMGLVRKGELVYQFKD